MTRLSVLLALAAALGGVLAFEISGTPAAEDGAQHGPAVAPAAPAASVSVSPAAMAGRQDTVDATLGRPVFSPARQPPKAQPAPADTRLDELPRLAGVILHAGRRSVIFAPSGAGKAVVAEEGGQVGAYLVEAIAPGQVRLSGPGGTRLVRPSFGVSAASVR